MLWLFIGLLVGLKKVLVKDFYEIDKKAFEDSGLDKFLSYPKNPKLVCVASYMLLGPIGIPRKKR